MNHKDYLLNRDFSIKKGPDEENDSTFMVPGEEGTKNVSEGVNSSNGPAPKDVNMQSSGYDSREIEAKRHDQGEDNIGTAGSAPSGGYYDFAHGDKKISDSGKGHLPGAK